MAKLLSIAASALFIILLLVLEIVLAHSSTGPHRPILPIKEIQEVQKTHFDKRLRLARIVRKDQMAMRRLWGMGGASDHPIKFPFPPTARPGGHP
ncbi:hypothetical protein Prudu_1087S000100 [Prunus dulcis]|uniref:Transmembrane protein n=1 Tax=Prunus dulcis TaxID=3755 RepID=A0A5H2YBT2_PRUDU|nr:hypothetical protein Prudu_1087S000100 [Prunus dulcis]